MVNNYTFSVANYSALITLLKCYLHAYNFNAREFKR
jgi:hypothetical protein